MKGTGAIKSPLDVRNIKTSTIRKDGVAGSSEYPESYFTDISIIPVWDQGSKPSCVAHAIGTMKEYFDTIDTGSFVRYSKRGFYARCKATDGIPNVDGTYPGKAMSIIKSEGIADESLIKDDITLSREEYNNPGIAEKEFANAQPKIIRSYAWAHSNDFEGLKHDIFDFKLVAVLISLDNRFFHYTGGVLPIPKTRLSGHEMVAYGYDKDYIYFRNSHGEDWGEKGNGKFDESYMNYLEEALTMVDLPNEYVKNLVSQKELLQKIVKIYNMLISLLNKK